MSLLYFNKRFLKNKKNLFQLLLTNDSLGKKRESTCPCCSSLWCRWDRAPTCGSPLKEKRSWKKIPHGVIVHEHEKGWVKEESMKIWFNKVWSRRHGGLLKKLALLIFGHFPAHVTQVQKQSQRTWNPTCCDTWWANQPTATSWCVSKQAL